MGNTTRNISIQTYDGNYHDIEVNEFYEVKSDGKEKIVVSYYDLFEKKSTGAVLIRENGYFVNSPLENQDAYVKFFRSISWRKKKAMDLALLPDRIHLCKNALEKLNSHDNSTSKTTQAESQNGIIVYIDNGADPDVFPYYIDRNVAVRLGFKCSKDYYHLNFTELEKLKKQFGIMYKYIKLSSRELIPVIRDISKFSEPFPYYLDAGTARWLGLTQQKDGHYHLNEIQLNALERKYEIEYVEKIVTLGIKTKENVTVYVDISPDCESHPHYLDTKTAGFFNLPVDIHGYHHLSFDELERIKRNYNVDYVNEYLGLGVKNIKQKRKVVVFIDIASNHDEFPYYLDSLTAKYFGGTINDEPYYHLTPINFDRVKGACEISYMEVPLGLGNGVKNSGYNHSVVNTSKDDNISSSNEHGKLSAEEIKEIDELFFKLTEFEDYYQFFGIESLRTASVEEVLKSSRIVELSELFKKAIACGDKVAVHLAEFLEGFKKSLVEKQNNK